MPHADEVLECSPDEVLALLAEGWQYVDVRTEDEFVEGHVPGALNIPFALRTKQGLLPDPDFLRHIQRALHIGSQVVVGCARGARSAAAARVMHHAGYTHVRNMSAGWDGRSDAFGSCTRPGWKALGLPVQLGT